MSGPVGGVDYIGLWFQNSSQITPVNNSAYATFYSYNYSQTTNSDVVAANNNNGIVMSVIDSSWPTALPWGKDYNADSGAIVFWVTVNGSNVSSQLHSSYAHDYNRIAIGGVSINPQGGINFTITNGTYGWARNSNFYTANF